MNIARMHAFFQRMYTEGSEAQSETAIEMVRAQVVREYNLLQELPHYEPLLIEFDYQCSLLGPQLDQWQEEIVAKMLERNFSQLKEHRRTMFMIASAENLGGKPQEIPDPFVRPYMRYMEMMTCRAIH